MDSISFDRIADRYDETRGGAERAENIAAGVAPHLLAGPTLEVGVGTGAIAEALDRLGHRSVGVDLSEAMLRRAADRVGARVARGDAHRLPARPGSCSNVLFVWVLHLVGDPVAALVEGRRALADGGRLITVSGPGRFKVDDLEPILEPMRLVLRRGRPEAEDLVALADAAGLTPLARDTTADRTYRESPEEVAGKLEQRTFSDLWDLDEATWRTTVQPAIAALRALPDPRRQRSRSARQEVIVFVTSSRLR